MPYQVSWYYEKRILYSRIEGDITLDEVKAMNDTIVQQYLPQGTPLVHSIVDVTRVGKYPMNVGQLSQAVKFDNSTSGWLVVVSKANPIIRFFASVITQVSDTRFRMYSTVDEAVTFLAGVDTTLEGLQTNSKAS